MSKIGDGGDGRDLLIRTLREEVAALRLSNGRLREALLEIWDSVPGTYDENDPMVKRHAKSLNRIIPLLDALSTPDDGLWQEVRHLCEMVLRLKVGDEMELPILKAADALLGGKP